MTLRKQIILCASALALAACSGGATNPMGPPTTPPDQVNPQTGTPTQTPATGTPAQTPAAMTPTTTTGQSPMMQPSAPVNGAAGSPATMPMAKPTEPTMPVDGANKPDVKPADTCTDRKVSYTKPCHSDPDPCN